MATVKEELEKSKGHGALIGDLKMLMAEAEKGSFHDFASDFATPKMELADRFNKLRNNVVNGRYDD